MNDLGQDYNYLFNSQNEATKQKEDKSSSVFKNLEIGKNASLNIPEEIKHDKFAG